MIFIEILNIFHRIIRESNISRKQSLGVIISCAKLNEKPIYINKLIQTFIDELTLNHNIDNMNKNKQTNNQNNKNNRKDKNSLTFNYYYIENTIAITRTLWAMSLLQLMTYEVCVT